MMCSICPRAEPPEEPQTAKSPFFHSALSTARRRRPPIRESTCTSETVGSAFRTYPSTVRRIDTLPPSFNVSTQAFSMPSGASMSSGEETPTVSLIMTAEAQGSSMWPCCSPRFNSSMLIRWCASICAASTGPFSSALLCNDSSRSSGSPARRVARSVTLQPHSHQG